MSITCVEAGDLLPESVPCSCRIGALPGSVETHGYRNGIILVEPSQARRDRLANIIETKWRTKVIARSSVEEWLKPCNYVREDLVLLSQLDSRQTPTGCMTSPVYAAGSQRLNIHDFKSRCR